MGTVKTKFTSSLQLKSKSPDNIWITHTLTCMWCLLNSSRCGHERKLQDDCKLEWFFCVYFPWALEKQMDFLGFGMWVHPLKKKKGNKHFSHRQPVSLVGLDMHNCKEQCHDMYLQSGGRGMGCCPRDGATRSVRDSVRAVMVAFENLLQGCTSHRSLCRWFTSITWHRIVPLFFTCRSLILAGGYWGWCPPNLYNFTFLPWSNRKKTHRLNVNELSNQTDISGSGYEEPVDLRRNNRAIVNCCLVLIRSKSRKDGWML